MRVGLCEYAPRIQGSVAPLRIPAFGRLLVGYTLNSIGDFVGLVALAVLVYAETGSAMATTALFIAGQFLPAFLAPVLTAHVDQQALRAVLPAIYFGEAAIFATLALLAETFFLPIVLALACLDGVLMLTARGLTRAAVNSVLTPQGMLREGNALLNIGFAVSNVGGAALGGLLVETFGVSTALAVDAGSFAAIGILLATSRHLPRAHPEPQPFLARVRAGLHYVGRNSAVRILLIGQGLALVLFTMIVPIEVIYAQDTLDTDEAGFGLLLSSWGAGIVLGSVLFVIVKDRSAKALILFSTLAIGVAYVGMAAARELWIACLFSVVGGLGNGIQWVSVMTALQEVTPADLQARVTGLLESIGSAAMGVGFLIGGVITSIFAPPAAFAVAGAGIVLLVVASAALLPTQPDPVRDRVADPAQAL